jgi:hypothetical protein
MAERPSAPSQSDQASAKVKAEGDRDRDRDSAREGDNTRDRENTDARGNARDNERDGRDNEREQPRASGRDRLDPIELRDVRDETSEKHRRGEDVGASGISNRTLAEEQEEQAEVPPRQTRKAGGKA